MQTNIFEGVGVINRTYAENGVSYIHNTTGSESDMPDLKNAYSTTDVADMLGVTERTVRNLCKSKEITHYRIGKKIVITETDCENYINSLKVEKE